MRLRLSAAALLAVASCGSPSAHEGDVTGNISTATLVEYAHWWTTHDDAASVVAIDPLSGRFALPRWAHAATAFEDLDGDRVLDPEQEPHAPCQLVDRAWNCHLTRELLKITHVESGSLSDPDRGVTAVNTSAELAAFDADGPRDDVRLCIHPSGVCALPGMNPLGPADDRSRALSPCSLTELSEGQAVRLELSVPPAAPQLVQVIPMEGKWGTWTVRRDRADVVVELALSRRVDRAIAWVGRIAGHGVTWSTEVDPSAMVVSNRRVMIRIPPRATASCPDRDCKVMVQVLNQERDDTYARMVRAYEVRLAMRVPQP